MTDPTTPASLEFPDEAGYPDGTGTLDEGTASEGTASDDIVDAVEPFDEGDDRDS